MVKTLCDGIYTLFLSGAKDDETKLHSNVHELTRHFFLNPITLDALDEVMELERKLLLGKGPNKQFIEEDLFLCFTEAARSCVREPHENTFLLLNDALIEQEHDGRKKAKHLMAFRLREFAIELSQFTKPRDSFATKRKAHALGILRCLSTIYEVPEAYALSLAFLKSKKRGAVFAAAEFLEYFVTTRDIPFHADVIELLDTIVSKTKDRSVAVSVLNLQVKTGHLSELAALSRIDAWKERHGYW
jgi:hypothetical protein